MSALAVALRLRDILSVAEMDPVAARFGAAALDPDERAELLALLSFEPQRRPWQVLTTVAAVAFGLGVLIALAVH